MRGQRTERRGRELAGLESEFRDTLILALRVCAGGRWGLFGQNESRSDTADELIALGDTVANLRRELGMSEPFELYSAFKAKRGRKDGNALGEQRLAQAWLTELEATS